MFAAVVELSIIIEHTSTARYNDRNFRNFISALSFMHFELLEERFMNTVNFFNNNARYKVIETKMLK